MHIVEYFEIGFCFVFLRLKVVQIKVEQVGGTSRGVGAKLEGLWESHLHGRCVEVQACGALVFLLVLLLLLKRRLPIEILSGGQGFGQSTLAGRFTE